MAYQPEDPDAFNAPMSRRQEHRLRKARRKARRRALPWYRRTFPTWRMLFGGLLTVLLLCVAAFIGAYLLVQVPDPNAMATAQANVYYYADGTTVLGRTGAVNRESVPITDIAPAMQHAVVSAEDRTFYSNTGIDVRGIARAGWNVATGKGLQSGSTITQQYVKNYYLTQAQTVSRKVKEVFIALKVDRTESKDAILSGYLNTSYFGRGAYGVQAAAQAYYGVNAAQLNTAQAAYLAALLQAPSAYDVATATTAGREAVIARWNYVLDGEVKLGWLTQAERNGITFPQPKPPAAASGTSGQAGYLIDITDRYLISNNVMDDATLSAGGWKIVTTFSQRDQNALVSAVKNDLTAQLPGTSAAKDVRVGAASVDPTSGKLVAAYGGPDYATQQFDDALRDDIQVGSTFKAFDLAAGLQNGADTQDGTPITPSTLYDGTSGRQVQGLPSGESYAPPNEDNADYGMISLRYAMMKSVNAVYAQEAADAGLDNVRNAAISAGLPADTPDMGAGNPALALGVATPSPLSMAGAYATFADHGQHIATWCVQDLYRDGVRQTLPAHPAGTAFSRATADNVTSVLQSVISPNGTGYVATNLGRPAAGKTGTTDDNKSAWFVGYTPQLTTAVALFAEDPTTHARLSLGQAAGVTRVNGGSLPAQIWTDYMSAALADQPVQDFNLMRGTDTTAPTAPSTPTSSPAQSTPPSSSPSTIVITPTLNLSPTPSPSRTTAGPAPSATPTTPSTTLFPTVSPFAP
jgi:membrane peptidoglycan carboxypeptidase